MVTPAQRREAIAHLVTAQQMSERRACRVAGVDRALVRYRARGGDDSALRERLKRWRSSAGVSAIGVCMCCCGGRVGV